MTIGGNDANFEDTLSFCALNTPFVDCQGIPYQRLSSGRELSLRDWTNLRLALLQNEVTQTYLRIREASQPGTRILAPGYAQIFGVDQRATTCPEFSLFRGGERDFLNTATRELNRRLTLAARDADITHVDVDAAFESFRVCDQPSSGRKYLTGIESAINNWSWLQLKRYGPGTFHPTSAGQDAYAQRVNASLAAAPPTASGAEARSLAVQAAPALQADVAPPADVAPEDESLLGPLPDLTEAELAEVAALEADSLSLGSVAEVLGEDPCAGIAVPRQHLVLQGDGFLPGAEVAVRFSSSGDEVGEYPALTADGLGAVRAGIVVPADMPTGQDADLALEGAADDGVTQRLSSRFQVQPPDSECGRIARDTGQLAGDGIAPASTGLPPELQAPVLTTGAPAVPAAPVGGVRRVAGPDRIATAVAISQESFETAAAVVVATAERYPDALAGGPFATSVSAPLLLTPAGDLDDRVLDEIRRLGAGQVVLLGGEAALAPAVAADLGAAGLAVERIGGATRYDTAAALAARLDSDEVVLVEGANPDPGRGWPDAVSTAGLAASQGIPVLLTERDTLPGPSAQALDGDTAVVIVGGSAAVGEDVAAQVDGLAGETRRLGGADRYATSRLVAEEAMARGLDLSPLWIATGNDFPDALAAGAAAGDMNATVLLVDGTSTSLSAESEAWFAKHLPGNAVLLVAGGPRAVSEELFAALGLVAP